MFYDTIFTVLTKVLLFLKAGERERSTTSPWVATPTPSTLASLTPCPRHLKDPGVTSAISSTPRLTDPEVITWITRDRLLWSHLLIWIPKGMFWYGGGFRNIQRRGKGLGEYVEKNSAIIPPSLFPVFKWGLNPLDHTMEMSISRVLPSKLIKRNKSPYFCEAVILIWTILN